MSNRVTESDSTKIRPGTNAIYAEGPSVRTLGTTKQFRPQKKEQSCQEIGFHDNHGFSESLKFVSVMATQIRSPAMGNF